MANIETLCAALAGGEIEHEQSTLRWSHYFCVRQPDVCDVGLLLRTRLSRIDGGFQERLLRRPVLDPALRSVPEKRPGTDISGGSKGVRLNSGTATAGRDVLCQPADGAPI